MVLVQLGQVFQAFGSLEHDFSIQIDVPKHVCILSFLSTSDRFLVVKDLVFNILV